MSGNSNFPTSLDDDSSLFNVSDNTDAVIAAHHNNIKEAVKKIEAKVGVFNTAVPTALDTRIGHPTLGHDHNGASGHGALIAGTVLAAAVASQVGTKFHVIRWDYQGSIPSGPSLGSPFSIPLTLQLVSLSGDLRRAPSGATTALDVNFGPTSIFTASQGLRPAFQAGTNGYRGASPNLGTYPSGTPIVIDADKVGTNDPGVDLSLVFVFRE